MKGILVIIFSFIVFANVFAQGHFVLSYEGAGQSHMNFNILAATLESQNLVGGDEIAVFDNTICVGKIILTGPILPDNPSTFITIPASMADTDSLNGYTEGNPISFKFWKASINLEISGVTAIYLDPVSELPITALTFEAFSSAFVKLQYTTPVNQVPVANSGIDQSVNEAVLVTLDGTASSDANNDALTYLWTPPSGITLSSNTASKPTFTAPEVQTNTNYTFSLVVNDGKANSTADQVVITVKQVNKTPVSNAGPDQSVNEGVVVTLDATASTDSDNDALTYLWTPPSGITLSSNTALKPTFTAPEVQANTNYTFSLIVNDGKVSSPADQVIITVKQVNKAPVAKAGSDQSVNEGVLVTLDGAASTDADNDVLTYLWTPPSGITLSSNTASKPTFTAPEVQANTNYTFSLVVNDGKTNSTADQVIITVRQVNKAPVANAGSDQSVLEGSTGMLDGTASSDPDNDALTYLWTAPSGITLSSNTASKPTFTAPEVQANTNYTFTLVVNDGKVSSVADQVIINIKQENKTPTANAGADQSVNEGVLVTLDGTASTDPDNDILNYKWTAPSGITLNSTTASKPTFTAPEVQTNTNYTFVLVVNDGTVNSTTDQVTITVKQINKAPVAHAGPDQTVNEGSLVGLNGSGSTDPDNNSLTYFWTAPNGVILSSSTAANPTFTAPEVQLNTNYTFSLVVNDGSLSSIIDQVVVTINQVNKNPVANAGNDLSINEGVAVMLDATASSDGDNEILTYLWTPPSGITLSSNTASKPTFTAPEVQANTNYTFSLVVNDGHVNSTSDQIIVTVKQVNKAPVANAGPDQSVDELQVVSLNALASGDADNDAITYLWTAPAGITLSSKTVSNPTFTAPEVSSNTNLTFSLVVNDGKSNSIADQVLITVKQLNKVPTANAGSDQNLNEGVTVTLDGSASTDPDNDILSFSWIAPAGITLSSSTAAKPTFIAPEVQSNTNFTFSLMVNDGNISSVADQVIVTVKQVNKTPVANAGTDQSVNEGLLVTLNGSGSTDADGDALSYSWSAPSGIILSSNTAANPSFTAPEVQTNTDFTFALTVSDGKVSSTSNQITVTIKQVNKLPVANSGPDKTVTENKLISLDGSLSSDADNDLLTYAWTSGNGITINSANTANPTFLAPHVLVNTNYTFSLVVNDGKINSVADQVVITVIPNRAPSANAGQDLLVKKNSYFTLDGTNSSDPDGDNITYKWTAPSGVLITSTVSSKPSIITPDVNETTNLTFSLIVNDGEKDSPPDEVTLTIKIDNNLPNANAGNDQMVNEGDEVSLNGSSSSDPDNDALAYTWTAPEGISLNSNSVANPTFNSPEVLTDTEYTFSLVVNDGTVNSAPDQVVVTVKQINKKPIAEAGANQAVNEVSVVTLDGSASSDPDNNTLTYLWTAPSGITLSSNTAVKPTFQASEVHINSNYTFTLTVNDGNLSSATDQVNVSVQQINKPPIANAGQNQTMNEGTIVTLEGTASYDPDNHGINYEWTTPPEIVLNSNTDPNPSFIAPEVSTNTSFTIYLTVNDGALYSNTDEVLINVGHVNKNPVANAGPDRSVLEKTLITLDGSSSFDADNDVVSYMWTAPSGIILSSVTTSKPTFTAPDVLTFSDLVFSLVVFDGTSYSAPDVVNISVAHLNTTPVADAGDNQTVNEGELVSLNGSGSSDAENTALNYLWTAPAGIVLSSNTNPNPTFLAPEVTTDKSYTISLVVSDGISNSSSSAVTVNVKQINKTPVLISSNIYSANVNKPFEFTLEGMDIDNDPISFSIKNLPSFMTLSKKDANSAVLSGIFQDQSIDNYFLELTLSDGNLIFEETITISISKNDNIPYIKESIPDLKIPKNTAEQIIDLTQVFADFDPEDILNFSIISNSNEDVVSAIINGTNLILTFSDTNTGISEIVVGADSNGQIVLSGFDVEVTIPTATELQSVDSDLKLYPNPTTGRVFVKFSILPKPDSWITVLDISGRQILKKRATSLVETLNLEQNSPGLYFVRIDQDYPVTIKVILR